MSVIAQKSISSHYVQPCGAVNRFISCICQRIPFVWSNPNGCRKRKPELWPFHLDHLALRLQCFPASPLLLKLWPGVLIIVTQVFSKYSLSPGFYIAYRFCIELLSACQSLQYCRHLPGILPFTKSLYSSPVSHTHFRSSIPFYDFQ